MSSSKKSKVKMVESIEGRDKILEHYRQASKLSEDHPGSGSVDQLHHYYRLVDHTAQSLVNASKLERALILTRDCDQVTDAIERQPHQKLILAKTFYFDVAIKILELAGK